MKVAMLTGGGDCPGLNAVIRAVVRKGERSYSDELIGFLDGWRGAMAEIVRVPLADAIGEQKTVDPKLYHGVAEVFIG